MWIVMAPGSENNKNGTLDITNIYYLQPQLVNLFMSLTGHKMFSSVKESEPPHFYFV